ncbi:MAG: hypothetical protein CME16_05950, partial [Gemmatimonadetes bacterium]|nr:hypothetical protein [Gemmatimonadota bacterium]
NSAANFCRLSSTWRLALANLGAVAKRGVPERREALFFCLEGGVFFFLGGAPKGLSALRKILEKCFIVSQSPQAKKDSMNMRI